MVGKLFVWIASRFHYVWRPARVGNSNDHQPDTDAQEAHEAQEEVVPQPRPLVARLAEPAAVADAKPPRAGLQAGENVTSQMAHTMYPTSSHTVHLYMHIAPDYTKWRDWKSLKKIGDQMGFKPSTFCSLWTYPQQWSRRQQ